MTIWLLAALMQLSTALVVESIQPADGGVTVTVHNTSAKVITAFGYQQSESLSVFHDKIEPIESGKSFTFRIPSDGPVSINISAVVFADSSYEGDEAKEILARREGVRQAELLTARQVRTFLQFNTVLDDNAMNVLDRELEDEPSSVPASMSRKEKAAYNEGYITTRRTVRKEVKEAPQEHRLQQLKQIGGQK
jgi:hypothetical protein